MKRKWLINGNVVGNFGIKKLNILIENEKIIHLSEDASAIDKNDVLLDCENLFIYPGFIDTQVHFREPGLETKEDLHTGSMAAVLGGITAVFEMPNTSPLTTNKERILDKLERAKKMYCEHAFYVGATEENVKELSILERVEGICGIKIFMGASTGDLLVKDDKTLRAILASTTKPIAIHAEDEDMLLANKDKIRENDPSSHYIYRSREAALNATKRIVNLAKETNRRVHILHISTKEEVEFLRHHKKYCTMEVLPQHLSFHAPECYYEHGTNVQMNPPIREKADQLALQQALKENLFDLVGSDHAPHTKEEKALPYPKSPSGIPGVQTIIPIMLDFVKNGLITEMQMLDLFCTAPQRIFSIKEKGKLAPGYDADFTIVDMNYEHIITNEEQASKAQYTPFHNKKVTAMPVYTIIRGEIIMDHGKIIATQPMGKKVSFYN